MWAGYTDTDPTVPMNFEHRNKQVVRITSSHGNALEIRYL